MTLIVFYFLFFLLYKIVIISFLLLEDAFILLSFPALQLNVFQIGVMFSACIDGRRF